MTYTQPNRCPPECREPRCNELIESVVTVDGRSIPSDRCASSRPMHPNCGWHTKHSLKGPSNEQRDQH